DPPRPRRYRLTHVCPLRRIGTTRIAPSRVCSRQARGTTEAAAHATSRSNGAHSAHPLRPSPVLNRTFECPAIGSSRAARALISRSTSTLQTAPPLPTKWLSNAVLNPDPV